MDWKALLAELKERGWTQLLLAAELGVSQSSISDLSNGKTTNPSYSLGRGLHDLYDSGCQPEGRSGEPKKGAPAAQEPAQPEVKAA